MGRISEARVVMLERQTANLNERLKVLEAHIAVGQASRPAGGPLAPPATQATPRAQAPVAPHAQDTPAAPATEEPIALAPPRAPRPALDLEDLLGGRVLAWTGGVAVVAGIAFLLAVAVSRGWIGPAGRTLLAGALSLGLVAAGIWLNERRRRGVRAETGSDAALATLSAGIAGLFLTVAVGGPVYDVLPVPAALALALGTGALATVVAVRWESRGVGALGIVGALLAPVLAGAPSTGQTLALLWLAAASGAAVLVWQRWNWLAFAVFAIALPQWGWWLGDSEPAAAEVLLVLCAFGALNVAAAIGFELRLPATRLRAVAALLLTLNAIALALAGWYALDGAGATTLGRIWLAALAAVHLGVGLATRATRINRDVRLLALVLGVVLADVTAGLTLEGTVLAAAFAATTAGFGALARRLLAGRGDAHAGRDEALVGLGLGGHMLLTSVQTLAQAPPAAMTNGDAIAFGGYVAIAITACAAFVAGRLVDGARPQWRVALDCAALTGAAYLTAVVLDGAWLAAAYAVEAAALAGVASRSRDAVAARGAAACLGLALGYALLYLAPPDALVEGLADVPGAALALGTAALAALRGAQLLGQARRGVPEEVAARLVRARSVLGATGAIALLHLASTALVTAFAPGAGAPDAGIFDLGARELGQLLLSALWATTGVTALVIGLRRDDRGLRAGALALLLVAVGKVFLYDLAALTSLYRVGSFIGLGLLLLVAAGTWQRMRPRPPAPGTPPGEPEADDVREVTQAVR